MDTNYENEKLADKNKLETALFLARCHRHELASKLLEELISKFPNEMIFKVQMGFCLLEQSKYGEAIALFEDLVRMDPSSAPAWGGMGHAFSETGQWDRAEVAYRRKLDIERNARSYVYLAQSLVKQSRFTEAIEVLSESIASGLSNYETYLNFGIAYESLHDYERAEFYFHKTVQENPGSDQAYCKLGILYYIKKSNGIANEFFRKAVELNPSNKSANNYISYIENGSQRGHP